MDELVFDMPLSSVENIPMMKANALFQVKTLEVFRDAVNQTPLTIGAKLQIMPWGADNLMPYRIIDLVESDETMTTCHAFNAEVCYGSGLQYDTQECTAKVKKSVEDFFEVNDVASYFLGCCQDFKYFGWSVSVIILNKAGTAIVDVRRKQVCYCRFTPADEMGRIKHVVYGNWRMGVVSEKNVEVIPLLDENAPLRDLRARMEKGDKGRMFAVVSRIPTADSTYYPIPAYASLFRSRWYSIKQLIAIAKEAKLKNSAPIKYHIEVSNKYFEEICKAEGITDRAKAQARIVKEKQNILDFLTGAENSGKVWFSTFYVNPAGVEEHRVKINRIDADKAGGDWESDIQEAINIECFALRTHSNLVGSVPGKAQTNNSGSDKRELYTIAQALQKPYRDLLFNVHRLIIRFNNWAGAKPVCPFIQLTTLDEHTDAKEVKMEA